MGSDIKSLRTRMKSVDSTMHLTRAMGLVASSKIRRATLQMNQTRQYATALDRVMASLLQSSDCQNSRYLADVQRKDRDAQAGEEKNGENICLLVIAGDRGLAGGYNANVFRLVRDADMTHARMIPIGKRACDRYDADVSIENAEKFTYEQAKSLADQLCDDFLSGKYEKVGMIETKYVSMMSQEATLTWLLPLHRESLVSHAPAAHADVVFEPDALSIFDLSVKEYVAGHLFAAVRESVASEVAARRCAMDSAEKNAQQMMDRLQLEYNRARQGTITQELTEIVAGANA